MHLIPRMATALVFFIYIGEEGLRAQFLTRIYTPKQLCGAALSDELQLVCEGKYNNMIKKGEATDGQMQEWRRLNIDQDNYTIFPFRSRRSALAFNTANFFRRRIRSIVNECCKKPCHLAPHASTSRRSRASPTAVISGWALRCPRCQVHLGYVVSAWSALVFVLSVVSLSYAGPVQALTNFIACFNLTTAN